MWEAIIKWIESKSYRCKHNWELVSKNNVYWSSEDKIPSKIVHIYRCTKCCESKKIST
jgi:hypothetical protein